ncbi:MAG TPA: type II TA system antitoxin MqsA family protein [Isosphaeraceae bacterium]|jgi:putative zinc finger/helix-turn-helix YgiT family protein
MADSKPYPWKCAACRERAVAPVALPSYSASLEHDGRAYEVELHDLPVLRCGHCGEVVFGDEAEVRLSDALRDAAGLLHPAEMRGRREALGLTQKQLARRLRIAESTLSRWETGAQIQQKCTDLMLRSFFDVPELRRYLDAIEPAALHA